MIEHPSIPAVPKSPVAPPVLSNSQAFPPSLRTVDVLSAARAHAHEVYPNEASGIVTEDGTYVRLENRSKEPENEVGVDGCDMIRLAEAQMYFHSHPNGPACPSKADMQLQMQLQVPFVIYCVDSNDMFCWGDCLPKPPLIGRAFRHGILDCYSLVRDWYQLKRNVTLIDRPREWDWWTKGDNFYEEGFREAGFIKIPKEEAVNEGDALLFTFQYKVIMHAALVVDKDLLLHHISGRKPFDPSRISATVPRSRWVRHALTGMRYVGGSSGS